MDELEYADALLSATQRLRVAQLSLERACAQREQALDNLGEATDDLYAAEELLSDLRAELCALAVKGCDG